MGTFLADLCTNVSKSLSTYCTLREAVLDLLRNFIITDNFIFYPPESAREFTDIDDRNRNICVKISA